MSQAPNQDDLVALSGHADKAARIAATRQAAVQGNAQQNLQRVQQGKSPRSLQDMIADHVMAQTEPDPEKNPQQYVGHVSKRIADLTKEQALAKKSKNIKAVQAYDQVIGILTQRMKGVQDKLASRMTAAPNAIVDEARSMAGPDAGKIGGTGIVDAAQQMAGPDAAPIGGP